jgi:hypothetical protein
MLDGLAAVVYNVAGLMHSSFIMCGADQPMKQLWEY